MRTSPGSATSTGGRRSSSGSAASPRRARSSAARHSPRRCWRGSSVAPAFAALDAGLDVHVFERGDVGAHPMAWGHMRMFTPWRMNVGPATRRHLEASGWMAPDPETCPSGAELAEHLLQPAAGLAEL